MTGIELATAFLGLATALVVFAAALLRLITLLKELENKRQNRKQRWLPWKR